MPTIHTQIDVAATTAQVWDVLIAFPAYGDWNPFIPRIEGTPRVGEVLEVDLQPAGRQVATLRPVVTEAQPGACLGWTGTVGVRGIFDGDHRFELTPTANGTRLVHRETFTGLLARPLLWLVGEQTTAGFAAMNRALRDRVEAATTVAV